MADRLAPLEFFDNFARVWTRGGRVLGQVGRLLGTGVMAGKWTYSAWDWEGHALPELTGAPLTAVLDHFRGEMADGE